MLQYDNKDNKDPEHTYHIMAFPDNWNGVYPIEDNMFTALETAFQLGEPIELETFKKRFISTYIEL